ncbi:MAG TPA: alcohol dehydrogenase catalytic domain-containing protein [Vicinamibacterales bacterium]|nr:alcohol dehydrogenase catalytic domain-containing protein [Vicinamibacterales bacterium]
MRALVLDHDGVRLRTDRPHPMPAAGEVLVRVVRAGICATDLQLIRGYKGFRGVLGHEFVGVALGGAFEGRRVVGEINCSCVTCVTCLAGRAGHCPKRTVIGILNHDGAFADLIAVPERNLHAVPETVDTDAAVFTEPLAAAFQIPAQISISRDDRVVVLGDGRLGNLCAQVLAGFSDHVLVIGRHPRKLALLDARGIETQVGNQDANQAAADIVVDCTGSPTGLTTALDLVRPRGTIVLKTTIAGTQTLSLAQVVVDEVTIVGSRCGPFDRALDALASGRVDVKPLISDRFDLTAGVQALQRAGEPGILKVLLCPANE